MQFFYKKQPAQVIRVSIFLTVALPFLILFFSLGSTAQQKCSNIFNSEKSEYSKWVDSHVKGLSFLTIKQQDVTVKFVELFWKRLSYADQRLLIYVLPENLKLTDIKEYEDLKGVKVGERISSHKQHQSSGISSGDRFYDDLRGCAYGAVCAIGIERFKESIPGFRHTLFHEVAHLVDNLLLSRAENDQLNTLFENATKRKLFLNDYSAINKKEYFAEAVEAYFSETKDAQLTNKYFLSLTIDNLKKFDSDLFDFIEKIVNTNLN